MEDTTETHPARLWEISGVCDLGAAIIGSYIVAWALFQYKDFLSRYRDSHYKDKMVLRRSYLNNGNSYIIEIRESRDHLIFMMAITTLVRWHLYIETTPWVHFNIKILSQYGDLLWEERWLQDCDWESFLNNGNSHTNKTRSLSSIRPSGGSMQSIGRQHYEASDPSLYTWLPCDPGCSPQGTGMGAALTAGNEAFQAHLTFSQTGPRLNIKTVFPRYGDSHVKDKTVSRPSYL